MPPISTTPASQGIAITNFDNEMIGLYRPGRGGVYTDVAAASGIGQASRATASASAALFFDVDLDGHLDLLAVNGHIDETVAQHQPATTATRSRRIFF